jgi:repressor LexA
LPGVIIGDNVIIGAGSIVNTDVPSNTVAAGSPILAEQNVESYFPLSADIIPKGEPSFILKVKGDSMINIGILDGDHVLVHQCSTANNGDIVVAMTDEGEVTLKTFYKEKDHIRLQPENDTMDPIILDNCSILGKAIGLYRSL